MTLALSTRWFGHRPLGAERLLSGLRETGLRRCSLARAIPVPPAADLVAVAKPAGVGFVAVECGPERAGGLASPNADERDRAMAATRAAIDLARRLGAERVVVDLGWLPLERARERDDDLRARLRLDGASEAARTEAAAIARDMTRHVDAALDRACRLLFDASRAAPELTIGVRTPDSPLGFPTFTALRPMLDELKSCRVAYWHDSGAAADLESLGLAPLRAWSGEHADRTAGASLHDVAGGESHLPPGAGEIDFRLLRETLPSGVPFVIDVDARAPAREVRLAASLLADAGYGAAER